MNALRASPGGAAGLAYFFDHSFAFLKYFFLSDLYSAAISATVDRRGLGSVSREQIDSSTFEIVRARAH